MIWAFGLLIVGLILHRASRPLRLPPRRDTVIDIEIRAARGPTTRCGARRA
jgi:hypothetical protein